MSQQVQIDTLVAEQHRLKERLVAVPEPEPEPDGYEAGQKEGERDFERRSEITRDAQRGGEVEGGGEARADDQGERTPAPSSVVVKVGADGLSSSSKKHQRKPPEIAVAADSDANSSGQEDAVPAAKAAHPPARKRRATGQKRGKRPGQASAWWMTTLYRLGIQLGWAGVLGGR